MPVTRDEAAQALKRSRADSIIEWSVAGLRKRSTAFLRLGLGLDVGLCGNEFRSRSKESHLGRGHRDW